jgi:hypothetical protein
MSHDRRIRPTAAKALGVLALVVGGTAAGGAVASAGPPAPAAGAAGAVEPPCARVAPYSPQRFTDPTTVSNAWHPLVPGTQWVMEGTADRGGGSGSAHRVVFTVTDLTKVIDGVRAVVVWDVDENEGQIVESELAFFAQDREGNVWKLGEYPEEYEDGRFVTASSTWITGLQNAEPGVQMPGRPEDWTTSSYLQGWAPASDFLDCAKTYRTGREVCVPAGCYKDVLVARERSPLDEGNAKQGKYYAPGVGNVKVDAVDDPEGETLELVGLIKLSPSALDEAVAEALKLDGRGYENSVLYRSTPRAERAAAGTEAPTQTSTPAASEPLPLGRTRLRARLPRPSRPPVTIGGARRRVVVAVDGALALPATVSKRRGCRGFVLVTLRRGRSVIVRRAMRVSDDCGFRRRFRVARSKLRGRRAVNVAIRFRGNDALGTVERVYPIRVGTR